VEGAPSTGVNSQCGPFITTTTYTVLEDVPSYLPLCEMNDQFTCLALYSLYVTFVRLSSLELWETSMPPQPMWRGCLRENLFSFNLFEGTSMVAVHWFLIDNVDLFILTLTTLYSLCSLLASFHMFSSLFDRGDVPPPRLHTLSRTTALHNATPIWFCIGPLRWNSALIFFSGLELLPFNIYSYSLTLLDEFPWIPGLIQALVWGQGNVAL